MAADLVTDHEAAKVTCKLKSAGKQARDHLAGQQFALASQVLQTMLGRIFSMSISKRVSMMRRDGWRRFRKPKRCFPHQIIDR
jgi:hypothetical protein